MRLTVAGRPAVRRGTGCNNGWMNAGANVRKRAKPPERKPQRTETTPRTRLLRCDPSSASDNSDYTRQAGAGAALAAGGRARQNETSKQKQKEGPRWGPLFDAENA